MSKAKSKQTRSFGTFYVEPIKPMTPTQNKYIECITHNVLTFSVGPAGTGKTWLATALAARELLDRNIRKLILTRPSVEAGESLGFLPGDLDQKFSPYLAPFIDCLFERLGKNATEYLLKNGSIEAIPLGYMRGRTFKDSWVILDEAQNTTPAQMKMFLTRIGEDTKVIVNGDTTQKDIKGVNGLSDALGRFVGTDDVGIVKFDRTDVVRSGLVRVVLDKYQDV